MLQHSNSSSRLGSLDTVRGVAILAVVLGHAFSHPLDLTGEAPGPAAHMLMSFFGRGTMGVDLFFVLSGYLIGSILIENRHSPNLLGVFWARRTLRILPLYAILLIVVSVVEAGGICLSGLTCGTHIVRWSYWTFSQNIAMAAAGEFGQHSLEVTWSLAVEEQFYLLLPVIILVLPLRLIPWLCVGALAVAALARVAAIAAGYPLGAYTLLPSRMDTLFAGVLVAWVVRSNWRGWLVVYRNTIERTAMILFVSAWGLGIEDFDGVEGVTVLGHTPLALSFAATIALVVTAPASSKSGGLRVAFTRFLQACGVRCFGLYLVHVPMMGAALILVLHLRPVLDLTTGLSAAALGLAGTWAAAWASWRWLEAPLISFGRRRFVYAQRAQGALRYT